MLTVLTTLVLAVGTGNPLTVPENCTVPPEEYNLPYLLSAHHPKWNDTCVTEEILDAFLDNVEYVNNTFLCLEDVTQCKLPGYVVIVGEYRNNRFLYTLE